MDGNLSNERLQQIRADMRDSEQLRAQLVKQLAAQRKAIRDQEKIVIPDTTASEERRAPVLRGADYRAPRRTIAWSEHMEAWQDYGRHYRQDAETIARRGGFSLSELREHLGHEPRTIRDEPAS